MSKYAFSESFGNFTDKDSEDAVLTKYKDNVIDHILQHYEIHVNSHNRLLLTSSQLLYYHVYGDYRLVLENNKPKFQYKTSPSTETKTLLNSITTGDYYLNSFINTEQPNIISGIYDTVENDGAIKHRIESVDWLNTELNKRGAGTRFTLPSIGTEIIKMHAYGNATTDIKTGFIDELQALSSFLDSNTPPIIYNQDSIVMINRQISTPLVDANFNNDISKALAIFMEALFTNQEYIELYTTPDPSLPLQEKLKTELRNVYDADGEYNTKGAISKMASFIFGSSEKKFNTEDEVILSNNISTDKVRAIATVLNVTEDQARTAIYSVNSFDEDNGYVLQTVDLVGGAPQVIDLDNINQPLNLKINENDLRNTVGNFNFDQDSGDVTTKKKGDKGGKKILKPALLVYHRIVIDTLAAVQILCQTTEWARQSGNNAANKTEAKMRFLSTGVNVYASNKTNQGDNKDKKIKPIDVYDSFPNITHFNSRDVIGVPPNVDSKEKLGTFGLLDELTNWRAYYTLSMLAKARAQTFDKDSMDSFYSSNILQKEIAWMSTALSDGTKILKRKEEPRELMAQIQYRYVQGTPKGVKQRADAPKETVFYEVDMPLLKEVIMTYTDVYNKSVIYRAFNTPVKYGSPRTIAPTESNARVIDLLKSAFQANKANNKAEKNRLVALAIQLQPGAFTVDQPYGWDAKTEQPKTSADPSPFPGITYDPKGRGWTFHVNYAAIPENLPGTDPLKDPAFATFLDTFGPLAPAADLGSTMVLTPRTTAEPVKEAELAKTIWTSVKTRTTGLFDLEGARPHEFMYQLFTTMDAQLERSNLIKAPYPESWFGTNIVDRLTTDPIRLGETVETRYYEEKLTEYIGALEKKYMNNYLVPSVLLTQTQIGRIKYNKNLEKLKMAFTERLAKDAASPQLVTTNYILKPYAITVAIMRGVLQIPEKDRSSFVAQEIDEDMRTEIRKHMYHNDIRPLLPREHPLFEPREKIPPPVTPPVVTPPPVTPPAETPPEMEVDQLDANWDEINPVIPELDDLDDIIFDNPNYKHNMDQEKFRSKWYFTDESKFKGQYVTTTDTGVKLQYKLHISISPDNYNRGRGDAAKLVSGFLLANKIYHKMGGPTYDMYEQPEGQQFGKMFTIYCATKKDFLIVAKGMKILSDKYKFNGIAPTEWGFYNNMQYEKVVKDTNNTVYYTMEKVDGNYLGDFYDGSPYDYPDREKLMDEHKGQGPLDAYVEWGN